MSAPLGEPPFDSRPRLCVGFSRGVPDRFLELSVLPLLSVPQHPRFTIGRRNRNRPIRRLHHGLTVRIGYIGHRAAIWHYANVVRGGRHLCSELQDQT
jgi:hypothetical protein